MLEENITITNIENFVNIPISAGMHHSITNRPSSGLVFSSKGLSKYIQDGKTYISDKTHVLYLPEKSRYSIECEKDDICPLINFKCTGSGSRIISFSIENTQLILENFKEFEHNWIFNKNNNYYYGMVYMYQILVKLFPADNNKDRKIPKVLKEALDYIHTSYTVPELSNDQIADRVKISTVYFRKLFKKYYGIPPMKYINDMRIRRAKELLGTQSMSVQETSCAVGFTSLYSFSRAFKKSTGQPPSYFKRTSIL